MNDMLAAALDYAAHGLPVFPCLPSGKTPAVRRGFHAATTNPATIRRYWTDPERNVAVPTGAMSGFWVLDLDGAEGAGTLRALEAEHGALPRTRTVLTARGLHVWFACQGRPVPSTVGRVGPGIDTRGDDGYVVVPPSVHPSGPRYTFLGDPWGPIVSAPMWLIRALRSKSLERLVEAGGLVGIGSHSRRRCPVAAYGQAALRAEIASLATTTRGRRNYALNRAAFNLFRLVAGGELTEDEVVAELHQACVINGLVADDGIRSVNLTIRSGRKAGLRYPRSRGSP
ncbi:bifunctional DNA primase/polymerase [Bradyrhizobium sp. WYCCWR 13023]|uniref:Bifunctional DNA primase/polymerase n=1 Tax=Bradyrhizobium zhengyangense TaxID=2911009 RepID=A0A9X1RHM1_9BRAD|nr:bifunctional DNA primase/polymerase [Bradyrhizobium zhengyangense]MCG2632854.1 bifunctional DNA primase/polymerase [Bradyrhizobium zhengyangense]